jgi:hypoxanthine-DNA glycosylase
VLGSLPGDVSLAQNQYYGHPQNQFWRLMSDVTGSDLHALSYPARLQMLQQSGVGLWDVIAEARRAGSLDSNIRDQTHNDLAGLVATLPALAAIAFNGATAARLGAKMLMHAPYRMIALPSSSPAYTLPYPEKLTVWRSLKQFLPD